LARDRDIRADGVDRRRVFVGDHLVVVAGRQSIGR
jgi:hypothetical protein